MTAPNAVRAWRDRLGLSQVEAARRLGMSTRQFIRYETGELQLGLTLALAMAAVESKLEPVA